MSEADKLIPAEALLPRTEALDSQVSRGFLGTHTRLSENFANLFQVASTVYALVDLMVRRGLLSIDEVQAQMAVVQSRLEKSDFGAGMRFSMHPDRRDKYKLDAGATLEVNCAERRHLCRTACCSLDVAIAPQDIEEGSLRWDYGRPYFLRRENDCRCTHVDRAGGGTCGVYEKRPVACRVYSCAGDERIWKDFANYVPNAESIDALLVRTDGPRMMAADPAASTPQNAASLNLPMARLGDDAGGGA
jgi:Fe-S-cluster containining protein